jgi:biotin operon repressor
LWKTASRTSRGRANTAPRNVSQSAFHPVSYDDCRRRFEISLRTFYRDIAALRDAGLYIAAEPNNYRMTCFVSDTDAA